MKTFTLQNDIVVFCITANSFPEGIPEAMQRIHSLAPSVEGRKYFGISRPENGGAIVYKAAAEEIQKGELGSHGLEEFIIPKGEYINTVVHDFPGNIPAIGGAFQEILHGEFDIDPEGYCIEWYLDDKDVRCMVKLKS
jgi:predicted transcriptional regulator YdeE